MLRIYAGCLDASAGVRRLDDEKRSRSPWCEDFGAQRRLTQSPLRYKNDKKQCFCLYNSGMSDWSHGPASLISPCPADVSVWRSVQFLGTATGPSWSGSRLDQPSERPSIGREVEKLTSCGLRAVLRKIQLLPLAQVKQHVLALLLPCVLGGQPGIVNLTVVEEVIPHLHWVAETWQGDD